MTDWTRNLLQETTKKIEDNGHTVADVRWVGDAYGWCPWAEFAKMAGGVTYDAGFTGQRIAEDLLVVGDDWWLERHEYDGSEWWEHKSLPTRPSEQKTLAQVDARWLYDLWGDEHGWGE